jgi:hypothetical protein
MRQTLFRRAMDLAKQQIISMNHFGLDSWSFPPASGSTIPRTVQFTPRFVVNSVRAAVASAVEGHGVTRLFSYQVAEHVREGRLQIVLRSGEHAPLPVNVVTPEGGSLSRRCAPSWTSSYRAYEPSSGASPRTPRTNPQIGTADLVHLPSARVTVNSTRRQCRQRGHRPALLPAPRKARFAQTPALAGGYRMSDF